VAAGYLHKRLSIFALEICRVGDREPPESQSLIDDKVHQIERVAGNRLIYRVVGDKRAALIRGDYLRRQEMARGKSRFAATGRAAQKD
jgi:hypothetical protein